MELKRVDKIQYVFLASFPKLNNFYYCEEVYTEFLEANVRQRPFIYFPLIHIPCANA